MPLAFNFLTTYRFSEVAVTSGTDESLDRLWGNLIKCVPKHSRFKTKKDRIYIGDNEWSWGIRKVTYIKGRPERFAGCMAEHSLIIITEAHLVEEAVHEVAKTFTASVIVNGSNV